MKKCTVLNLGEDLYIFAKLKMKKQRKSNLGQVRDLSCLKFCVQHPGRGTPHMKRGGDARRKF